MTLSVSINGLDDIGKSTQITMLPQTPKIRKIGRLRDFDSKMATLHTENTLGSWWWSASSEDFVCTIYHAVQVRMLAAVTSQDVDMLVFDRGGLMWQAVSVARIATTNNCDLVRARALLANIVHRHDLKTVTEDVSILLQQAGEAVTALQTTLARATATDERYHSYQQFLQAELLNQQEHRSYHHVVTIGCTGFPSSPLEIQDAIRRVISSHAHSPHLPKMLSKLRHIYVLCGHQKLHHKDLIRLLLPRLDRSGAPNSVVRTDELLDPEVQQAKGTPVTAKEQALHMVQALDRDSGRRLWVEDLILTAIGEPEIVRQLKFWLGDRLKIIHIKDEDIDTREKLSSAGLGDVEANIVSLGEMADTHIVGKELATMAQKPVSYDVLEMEENTSIGV